VNKGQGVESVKAAVITNIFTGLEFRRMGMATDLLTAVRRCLDNMESKRIEFSIIYSGVNNRLYKQLG
jgi:predicted acetyltransferase